MKNKKRRILSILSLLCTFLLVGCGKDNIDTTTSKPDKEQTAVTTENTFFTKEEDVPRHEDGRAIVTLSSFIVNDELSSAVVAFNQSNSEYYVEILSADRGTSVSDYWDRENIEIAAGKGPDLFSKNSNTVFMTYIEKDLIEDLAPYIERDINKEDYLENSLYAYAKDGKVYAVEPYFSVSFLAGSKEMLGDRTGWNLAEVTAIIEAHPELITFESYSSPGGFLHNYLGHSAVDYTDYEKIKACIEFDKAYSKDLPNNTPDIPGQTVLVTNVDLRSPLGWADCEALYQQDLTPIGYVNEQQEGIIHSSIGLSINANSKQKEGAWAFLRFLLSEEYQREIKPNYYFSPLKALLEEQIEYYSKPITNTFYVEELGQEITTTQNHTLSRASGANYMETVEIECMTAEQLQTVRDLVARSKVNCFNWDETAIQIITEEADAYFNDKRSLEDVMANIKNRMDLYVSEQQ